MRSKKTKKKKQKTKKSGLLYQKKNCSSWEVFKRIVLHHREALDTHKGKQLSISEFNNEIKKKKTMLIDSQTDLVNLRYRE